ncbi:MAG: dienelactone hydrolase family protein [Bacteriovorax sp.]
MLEEIVIKHEDIELKGHITSGKDPRAWVLFAHGSGSSRFSKRNNWVANELVKQGFATMLFDLMTEEEDETYMNRFNIPLLADRLLMATSWLMKSPFYRHEPIAYFGASTGAGAALIAASRADESVPIYAVVSRGGRPDLAGVEHLNKVFVPTLLIVGSRDTDVIKLNEYALSELPDAKLVLVPGATHLFEEPGTLNEVVKLSGDWFQVHLQERESKHL